MAIVGFARNGIGLGHISRMVALCEGLTKRRFRPYLFAEGAAGELVSRVVPTICVGGSARRHVYDLSELSARIQAAALLTDPACVIEDTYPVGLRLNSAINRVLLVRPLTFEALQRLAAGLAKSYDMILLADNPDSPTWPYSGPETREIAAWHRWRIVGPLFRVCTDSEIRDVRRRYRCSEHSRLCVFSMGGGGEHAGADDGRGFVREATCVADRIRAVDSRARLIFVRGPLMTRARRIGPPFEEVTDEPMMPALFAAADLACIRPGFNSTWECIAGDTPIYAIQGTSFEEPVSRRISRLREQEYVVDDVEAVWSVRAKSRASRSAPSVESTHNLIAQCLFGRPRRHRQQHRRFPPLAAGRAVLLVTGNGRETACVAIDHATMLADALRAARFDVDAMSLGGMQGTRWSARLRAAGCAVIGATRFKTGRVDADLIGALDGDLIVLVASDAARVPPQAARLAMLADATIRSKARDQHTLTISYVDGLNGHPRIETGADSEIVSQLVSMARSDSRVEQLRRVPESDRCIFVRIDDVASLTPAAQAVLDVTKRFGIHASLQVIPYLCECDARDLERHSIDRSDVSVGQHGFCHVSREWTVPINAEFGSDQPSDLELRGIRQGFASLEQRFGDYFDRGFSPPFDALPKWLGSAWEQAGGRFVSTIRGPSQTGRVGVVTAAVDLWNWNENRRRSVGNIVKGIIDSCARWRYAGLVVHPRHFARERDVRWFEQLLLTLVSMGFVSRPMHTLAALPAALTRSTSLRAYSFLPPDSRSLRL